MVTSHFTRYAKNTDRCSREHTAFMPLHAPFDTRTCGPLRNTIAIRRRGRHRALDVYWLIESEQLIQGRRKSDPAFRGFSTASCSRSGSFVVALRPPSRFDASLLVVSPHIMSAADNEASVSQYAEKSAA